MMSGQPNNKRVNSAKDLDVYRLAYELAMAIFESSNSETDSSLDFARDCEYMSADEHQALTAKCAEIGRMLGRMLKKSQSFLIAEC